MAMNNKTNHPRRGGARRGVTAGSAVARRIKARKTAHMTVADAIDVYLPRQRFAVLNAAEEREREAHRMLVGGAA